MATASREPDPDLNRSALQRLLETEPHCVPFFQAVRLLTQVSGERKAPGTSAGPDQEAVRFTANPSSSFPASEIQSLTLGGDKPSRMTVNFMGLTGPQGALPLAYTELVMERMRARDPALRDFLDIFNHRIISLFYQAWEKSHPVIEPADTNDKFSEFLLALIGLGSSRLQRRQQVSDSSLLYYAGLLAPHARSAAGLEDLLSDYFDVPLEVVQFTGEWYRLDNDDQTRFGDADCVAESLGVGTALGDEVWDQQSKATIRIGPLELERYLDFLPTGEAFRQLRALVRFYFNEQLDFQLQLVLKREATPPCQLGEIGSSAPRLGWLTWMKSAPRESDSDETILAL